MLAKCCTTCSHNCREGGDYGLFITPVSKVFALGLILKFDWLIHLVRDIKGLIRRTKQKKIRGLKYCISLKETHFHKRITKRPSDQVNFRVTTHWSSET